VRERGGERDREREIEREGARERGALFRAGLIRPGSEHSAPVGYLEQVATKWLPTWLGWEPRLIV